MKNLLRANRRLFSAFAILLVANVWLSTQTVDTMELWNCDKGPGYGGFVGLPQPYQATCSGSSEPCVWAECNCPAGEPYWDQECPQTAANLCLGSCVGG